jgi:hypothetical protein
VNAERSNTSDKDPADLEKLIELSLRLLPVLGQASEGGYNEQAV